MGICVSMFTNEFKAPQGRKMEACCPVCRLPPRLLETYLYHSEVHLSFMKQGTGNVIYLYKPLPLGEKGKPDYPKAPCPRPDIGIIRQKSEVGLYKIHRSWWDSNPSTLLHW